MVVLTHSSYCQIYCPQQQISVDTQNFSAYCTMNDVVQCDTVFVVLGCVYGERCRDKIEAVNQRKRNREAGSHLPHFHRKISAFLVQKFAIVQWVVVVRKQIFLPGPGFSAAEHVVFGTKGHHDMFINAFQSKCLARVS